MRFRYECEGRSVGSIFGESSTEVSKTLSVIEVGFAVGAGVALFSFFFYLRVCVYFCI